MVEIDPDYEDFYECRGPSNKAVRIMWLVMCHIRVFHLQYLCCTCRKTKDNSSPVSHIYMVQHRCNNIQKPTVSDGLSDHHTVISPGSAL